MTSKNLPTFTKKVCIALFAVLLSILAFLTIDTLLLLFLTYIIAQGLSPIVTWVDDKTPLNRGLSVALVVSIASIFILGILWVTIQILISDFTDLLSTLPMLIEEFAEGLSAFTIWDFEISSSTLRDSIPNSQDIQNFAASALGSLISVGGNIVGVLLSMITLAAITFFQVNNPDQVRNFLVSLFPKKSRETALTVTKEIELKLGRWLLGQLTLVCLLGIFSYLGFKLFGLPFALPLAVIAGISDIVPVVGPVVAFIPLIIVAFASLSWPAALGVVLYFLVIQQIEGNVVVPKVMEKAVGLSGIVVIAALMIGSQLYGVLGALLAIPSAIVVKELYITWQKYR